MSLKCFLSGVCHKNKHSEGHTKLIAGVGDVIVTPVPRGSKPLEPVRGREQAKFVHAG